MLGLRIDVAVLMAGLVCDGVGWDGMRWDVP